MVVAVDLEREIKYDETKVKRLYIMMSEME
jgi:hypothetical protein